MFRKIFLGSFVLALVVLSFPLSNLLTSHGSPDDSKILASIKDPQFKKAAHIFQNKCMDCHSAHAKIPFYANFPVAKDLIQKDMEEGKDAYDMTDKLAHDGHGFTDLDLARLEGVLSDHSMPPLRYVAMHWDARLSQDDETTLLSWIQHARTERRAALGMHEDFVGEPIPPLPLTVKADPDKVALGNLLFHDKRLSADQTLSCASCHALNKGGTDRSDVSTGINGQKGPINAPTVYNAVYNVRQFWNGRAADLTEQAGGPVTNPKEMGASWPQVLARLKQDPKLMASFNHVYSNGLNSHNVQDAIATFETTLVTPNSRFDQYLRGNKHALSSVEIKGYQLFKANCASCHAGPNLGGLSFEKMGRASNYFTARGGQIMDSDYGLYGFSKKEKDRFKFKVPTLRNIAQTGPYFHDASAKTLEDAVRKMGKFQVGKTLNDQEVSEISAFLRTLTGQYQGRSVQ